MAPLRTVADWRTFAARWGVTVAGDVPVVVDPPPVIAPPPPLDIPVPGNPFPVIVKHLEYAWEDVASTVSGLFHNFLDGLGIVGGIGINEVEAIVTQAINFDITAWSSFVNQLNAYAQYIAADMSIGITDLGNFVIDGLRYAEDLAQGIGDYVGAVLGGEIAALGDRVTGLEHTLFGAIDFAAASIEAWAIDNLYHPLLGEITNAADAVRAEVLGELANVEDWVRSELNTETLERIAAVGAIAASIATAITWIEDCGAPMCDTVGPKTDWGKWLKLFGPLALWSMLAAVAAEDPAAIESGAEGLAQMLGPVLEHWVTTFALGGGSFPAQPSPVGGAIGSNPLGL